MLAGDPATRGYTTEEAMCLITHDLQPGEACEPGHPSLRDRSPSLRRRGSSRTGAGTAQPTQFSQKSTRLFLEILKMASVWLESAYSVPGKSSI